MNNYPGNLTSSSVGFDEFQKEATEFVTELEISQK